VVTSVVYEIRLGTASGGDGGDGGSEGEPMRRAA
jgi:hypothetical protein